MRKIKFRGHAVEEMFGGQWVYGFGVEEIECTQIYTEKTGRKNNFYLHTDYGLILVHEKSIGQYTGLKDKNGVEIYEGDIVQCTHWFFDGNEVEERFIASVGFKDGSFVLENITSKFYSGYTGEENGTGTCWIGAIDFLEEDYEIIGNIYENPELLEGSE